MSVQLLWQQPVFYIIFVYLLMKRTLMNFFLDEFNGDDGDDDCELPAYVPRPQAVAKRNQMAIFLNH